MTATGSTRRPGSTAWPWTATQKSMAVTGASSRDQVYFTQPEGKEPDRRHEILAYLPTRTALVLRFEE